MRVLISILPVLFYLIFLIAIDSHKIIKYSYLFFYLLFGIIASSIAFIVNGWIYQILIANRNNVGFLYLMIVPLIEDLVKTIPIIILLLRMKNIHFLSLITISGSIGLGYSILVNIFVLKSMAKFTPALPLMLHGLGLALENILIMMCFTLITLSMLKKNISVITACIVSILLSYALHILFNFISYNLFLLWFLSLTTLIFLYYF